MKSILGTLALGLILTLAYGVLGLYEAGRDKAIAPNEATATDANMQPSRSNVTGAWRCIYAFRVGDNLYGGRASCPTNDTADSAKGALGGFPGMPPNSTATIYYDPNDPSYNSLVDFSVKADNDSMKARFAFGLAVGCVLLLVIGVVITVKASQPGGDGGIMVDAQGTMLYPDQIKSDPDDERFSAHPKHISSEETD